jgi:hypothetical protein
MAGIINDNKKLDLLKQHKFNGVNKFNVIMEHMKN